jgi:hypothetical protein
MRVVPVVAMLPWRQFSSALVGGVEGGGIGPFTQGGPNETFDLAFGLRRIGFGADVLDAE